MARQTEGIEIGVCGVCGEKDVIFRNGEVCRRHRRSMRHCAIVYAMHTTLGGMCRCSQCQSMRAFSRRRALSEYTVRGMAALTPEAP